MEQSQEVYRQTYQQDAYAHQQYPGNNQQSSSDDQIFIDQQNNHFHNPRVIRWPEDNAQISHNWSNCQSYNSDKAASFDDNNNNPIQVKHQMIDGSISSSNEYDCSHQQSQPSAQYVETTYNYTYQGQNQELYIRRQDGSEVTHVDDNQEFPNTAYKQTSGSMRDWNSQPGAGTELIIISHGDREQQIQQQYSETRYGQEAVGGSCADYKFQQQHLQLSNLSSFNPQFDLFNAQTNFQTCHPSAATSGQLSLDCSNSVETTSPASSSQKSNMIDNPATIGTIVGLRRGRPRKSHRSKAKLNGKLWEFIRDLLLSESTNPSFIRWERREDGVFKFVQSDKVAKMWGERKQNPKMTYEKLSRAMRYYYKSKVLLPVFGRRLVYKFGPNATGWLAPSSVDGGGNP